VYHVVSRGNARQEIYSDDRDRRRFLVTLRCVAERLNVACHAYCLMGNHYHLLLETPDANLSLAVRQLNGVYAQTFNRRHGRVGHLFQGRFSSKLVETDGYLLVVVRYIVLNPVRASLVAHPSHWTWSSYRAHAGEIDPPPFLTTDSVLAHFGTADRWRARRAFRSFVDEGLKDSRLPLDDRPFLGSDRFIAGFRDRLAGVAPLKAIPRAQRLAARPTLLEVFADCAGRRDRNARIRRAHIEHGYTMTAIAQHLKLHVMTISRAIRSDVGM
jgi:REP element-mobilizing transposase RayT